MKRVGLYCRDFGSKKGGAAVYTTEMAKAIVKQARADLDLFLIVPQGIPPLQGAGVTHVALPAGHRLIQDHFHASRAINRLAMETVWFPKNAVSLGAKCKPVVSFLDLAYFRPQYHAYGWLDTLYMSRMMRRSAKLLAHAIAISEYTKRDVVDILGVPEERVSVIYAGVAETFRVIDSADVLDEVKCKYGLPDQFIFFAGGLTPRKNLVRLLEAFKKIRHRIPHHVAFTGTAVRGARRLLSVIDELGDRVVRLNRVPGEDLPALYNLASLYAHPSLFEGFGLTVVEAQACGTPVLNSNASCLPEIGGDAALYVDPYRVDDIAEGLEALATDAALREDLVRRGFENARRFSWAKAAQQAQQILLEV